MWKKGRKKKEAKDTSEGLKSERRGGGGSGDGDRIEAERRLLTLFVQLQLRHPGPSCAKGRASCENLLSASLWDRVTANFEIATYGFLPIER